MNSETEKTAEYDILIKHIYNIQLLEYDDRFVFESVHQNDWRLLCVYRDEVETLLDGKWVPLLAGRMVLIPPDESYGLRTSGKSHPQVLLISLSCAGAKIRSLTGIRHGLSPDELSILNDIFSLSRFTFNQNPSGYDQLIINKSSTSKTKQILKNKLELLLLGLLEAEEQSETFLSQPPANILSRQMLIKSIDDYLNDNLFGSVKLSSISSALNFSSSYLNSVYRASTGKSIVSAFNEMKINRAKTYLEQSDYSVTQISEFLGFSSVHYFSRAFKKIAGITPTEYLEQSRNSRK